MLRVRCPICHKAMEVHRLADWPNFPFCSPRCRVIDLGRWLGEEYRVAAPPDEVEEGQAPDTQAPS